MFGERKGWGGGNGKKKGNRKQGKEKKGQRKREGVKGHLKGVN